MSESSPNFQQGNLLPRLVDDVTIATPYGFQQVHVYDCPVLHADGTADHGRLFLVLIAAAGRVLTPAVVTPSGAEIPAMPVGVLIGMSLTSAAEALDVAAANLAQAAERS